MKAIIAINLYAIVAVAFVYSNKVVVNEMKTPVYDLTFIINFVGMFFALAIACCSKEGSFAIAKKDRLLFFVRCFEGWVLILVAVIGNTLLPVTV